MAGQNVHIFTEENFEQEVLTSPQPVLVDFWAEWCGPCKMLAPVIDEVAEEKAGAVKVGKIDVDACPSLAQRFAIRAIPTLLIFKNGEVQQQMVGMTGKQEILSKLSAVS
jgi:thioredoxin 1